ncbi:MAG TPA: phosphopantetheine-binding protein [Rubricoccaceae bacterium]|jgi:acyl carrier protein|nr:phosphopantetheine-binding protein [Rubricoccaceae bacterium]
MEERLVEAVKREVAKYAEVTPDEVQLDDLFETLGVDSLDAVGLVADLEEEFEVTVPDDALTSIYTVGDAVAVLRQALDGAEDDQG